jgi:hypothetical protein
MRNGADAALSLRQTCRKAVDTARATLLHSEGAGGGDEPEEDTMKRTIGMMVATMALTASAHAKPLWVKKAQAEDPKITSCLACHTAIKVTKEDLKLTARGQFLMDKKKELKAEEVDLKWLKDYKETK